MRLSKRILSKACDKYELESEIGNTRDETEVRKRTYVGGIADEFAKENLLVAVEGVDDET